MIIQTIELYFYEATCFIIHFFNKIKINKQSDQVDWCSGQAYNFVFSTNVMCPVLIGNCKQPLVIPSCIARIESDLYKITFDHQKITGDYAGIISDCTKIIADHVKMTFEHAEIIFKHIIIAPGHRKITYDGPGAKSTIPATIFFSFFL